jgi:integrase
MSKHKQELAALLFLFKHVLRIDLPWLNEAFNLRVKHLDFSNQTITVREGEGKRDRSEMLPVMLLGQME